MNTIKQGFFAAFGCLGAILLVLTVLLLGFLGVEAVGYFRMLAR